MLVAQLCSTLQPHGLQPARLLCSWQFLDKNPGVGSHSPLQGIFQTQGSKLGLLHWSHQEDAFIEKDIAKKTALETSN